MSNFEHKEFDLQLSEEIRQFNNMLLSVSWHDADFNVYSFTKHSKVCYDGLSVIQNKLIRNIIKYIPEWERVVGCKQHDIHDYCLDFHTIAVLKNLQSQEKFQKLSDYNKLILLYSGLLHDLEKNENEIDPEHPIKGAKKSSSILYRLGFDENFINTVYQLIKNHQVLGFLSSGKVILSDEELVNIFKIPFHVELLIILSIADIRSVKKDGSFFKSGQNEKFNELKEKIKSLIVEKNKI